MPNLLTETNLNLDTCVPTQLSHVQMPDLPISTYADVDEACRDIAGQLAAAGESGSAVLEDICRHFSLHSGHLGRLIADIQARGVKMGPAYIPGGQLPAWVTTVPEVFGESRGLGWMSSLSHSLQSLWGCLRSYTWQTVFGAILVVVVVLQLRKNAGTGKNKPPIRGDEVYVSQPAIAAQPSAISAMGGQGPTTNPPALINQALGHLSPTQVCCQRQKTKRKVTDEVSVDPREAGHVSKKRKATEDVAADPGEAEHVSKKRQTADSMIETAVTPKPKKRGRPRKHKVAQSGGFEDKVNKEEITREK